MTDDPEDQGHSEVSNNQENDTTEKKDWMITAFVVVAILLLGILAYAMFSSSGFFVEPDVFITIAEPAQGETLDVTIPVTVRGHGGGLFEGNVIIQVLDAKGHVLAQQPTTIDAPDAGIDREGPWSVELAIDSMPGIEGQILAFSTSPADGSTIASDSVNVTFGEAIPRGELINLEDHLWLLVSLKGEPLIEKTTLDLHFENFKALGSGGCNRYFTSYERKDSYINFELVTSTAKSCELPEGIMDQEKEYFTALEQAAAFTTKNQQLMVFNNSNELLLIYDAIVKGSVFAAQGSELPKGAVVNIRLNDVSLADAEAELIAEQVIIDANEFPIPFLVTYDPEKIIEDHSHAIGVRVEDSLGNLLFINTTAYPVITGGNPLELEVMVEAIY